MDDITLVQVLHPLGDIDCYFEQSRDLEGTTVLVQIVVDTPAGHEL